MTLVMTGAVSTVKVRTCVVALTTLVAFTLIV